jgi:predicted nucleotidyltransferase
MRQTGSDPDRAERETNMMRHVTLMTQAEETAAELREALGGELVSCCVYGSVVRGDANEKTSDINLLIILRPSGASAHDLIARVLRKRDRVVPFVLGADGLSRSVRAFAAKFSSILRNYKVLQGDDSLKDMRIDPAIERFLCEQALRNLRLRLGYVYIRRRRNSAYAQFLAANIPGFFADCGEALRLEGLEVPRSHDERIGLFAREFGMDTALLRELQEFRAKPPELSDGEKLALHGRMIEALHLAIGWIEKRWVM